MDEKKEKMLSLPGVVGLGYGKKFVGGQSTDTEALIIFVEKKKPVSELQDHEIIPTMIDDMETDVIETGEIQAYDHVNKNQNNWTLEIFSLVANYFNQRITESDELNDIITITQAIKRDLHHLETIRNVLVQFNFNSYKDIKKYSFQEFSDKVMEDIKNIRQLKEALSSMDLEVYKKAGHLLAIVAQQLRVADIISRNMDLLEALKALFGKKSEIDRTSSMVPAFPGVSIGHYQGGAGTFGAVVYDRKSGDPRILSNNHILANTTLSDEQNARINDAIVQPATGDGNSKEIGKLEKFAVLNPYPEINVVDCALAKPLSKNDIKPEIIDIGKVNGITDAVIGMKIQKSGRTTGLTTGEVIAVETTIRVNYGSGKVLLFERQIIATNMSEPGDSGSLVLDMYNNAIGLLFAGSSKSTIINPIDPVLDLLDVQINQHA